MLRNSFFRQVKNFYVGRVGSCSFCYGIISVRLLSLCSWNRSPSLLLVSPMNKFLQRVQLRPCPHVSGYFWKRRFFSPFSKMMDRLGRSQYFLNVTNERTCFASCARALKGNSLVRSVFQTSDQRGTLLALETSSFESPYGDQFTLSTQLM